MLQIAKKVTKGEKGLKKPLATTLKLHVLTLGFGVKTAYCLRPYVCNDKIICIGLLDQRNNMES